MIRLLLIACLMNAIIVQPLLLSAQNESEVSDATASQPSMGVTRSAPPVDSALDREVPQTAVDLSNVAAQISFLVFIVLIIIGYLFLRRLPASESGNKRKKL